jgi:hypothetical protein
MNGVAYAAVPDYAKMVLFALACRFHGHNNGDLSLVPADAATLGVRQRWKLYAGLSLLRQADLIQCTRQGRLQSGTKLCSLYALTWRGINVAPNDVLYDGGVSVCPLATNAWAKWKQPDGWAEIERSARRANHGQAKIPVSTTTGNGRSTTGGDGKAASDQPRGVQESPNSVPRVVDSSKTQGGGTA